MKLILTGSISNIGKPLTEQLVRQGHQVTVISSQDERRAEIQALGATAAIGQMQDADFLAATFKGADVVYLMETLDAAGDYFDKDVDFIGAINHIGNCYKKALEQSGITQIVHLSSIGAHMDHGNGILIFHYNVENILKQLSDQVAIKTIRPVGFYTNMFSFISQIKSQGAIVSNYGGDQKEPWVSPKDIALTIAQATESPFLGRSMTYVASDEFSPNEAAQALGQAIGKPGLAWSIVSDQELLDKWLAMGFNAQIAHGFVELQRAQGSGELYQDYYRNRPELGRVKLTDFAKDFAAAYHPH